MTGPRQAEIADLSLKGRLDGSTVTQAETALKAHLEAGRVHIIVDMSQLEYVSSAGLKLMLSILKKSRNQGGSLVLFGLSGHVWEVFDLAGLTDVIPMAGTREAARALAGV